MECNNCHFLYPITHTSGECIRCNNGRVLPSATELLSKPELGFIREVRPGQVRMAEAITKALDPRSLSLDPLRSRLVFAEGGCGIGKTYAYILATLLSYLSRCRTRPRIVIATGNKSLQDQLETKDLPYIKKALSKHVPSLRYACLKGKNNYVCYKALLRQRGKISSRKLDGDGSADSWEEICVWAGSNGDLDKCPSAQLSTYLRANCSVNECTGLCQYGSKDLCRYVVLKREIVRDTQIQIVVTNHHLLGVDWKFKNRILGDWNILVIDEAHNVCANLRQAMADTVSHKDLHILLNKMAYYGFNDPFSPSQSRAVFNNWDTLFQTIPDEPQYNFLNRAAHKNVKQALDMIKYVIDTDVSKITRQGSVLVWSSDDREQVYIGTQLCERIEEIRTFFEDTYEENTSYFYEKQVGIKNKNEISLSKKDIDLSRYRALFRRGDTILTSATLNRGILTSELQTTPDYEICEPSPFNFKRQALLYIPKHLVRYDQEDWHSQTANEIVQLIRASKGNALVLFSAKKDLSDILRIIREEHQGMLLPLIIQSSQLKPKQVLDRFNKIPHSTIFGLRSFFEGIDIPGSKLRLVILVKMPFLPPNDPLLKAKERVDGRNFTYSYNLMETAVRQAAGRLIRSINDKGVLAILDVRIWTGGKKYNLNTIKLIGTPRMPWVGYGRKLYNSLPPMQTTSQIDKPLEFLRWLANQDK